METTCLASLTHVEGDILSLSLALACKIPYIIAIYCIFKSYITRYVVLYDENTVCVFQISHGGSMRFIYIIIIIIINTIPRACYRDIHDVLVTLGYGMNAVFSKILKECIAQPRPTHVLCQELSTCHSYGMPSTHSQFMFFCASYATFYYLLLLHKRRRRVYSTAAAMVTTKTTAKNNNKHNNNKASFEERRLLSYQTRVELWLLWIMALTVAYARVSLGYHSISQVLVGGTLGIICAYLWYRCVQMMYRYGICRMICESTEQYLFKCPVLHEGQFYA